MTEYKVVTDVFGTFYVDEIKSRLGSMGRFEYITINHKGRKIEIDFRRNNYNYYRRTPAKDSLGNYLYENDIIKVEDCTGELIVDQARIIVADKTKKKYPRFKIQSFDKTFEEDLYIIVSLNYHIVNLNTDKFEEEVKHIKQVETIEQSFEVGEDSKGNITEKDFKFIVQNLKDIYSDMSNPNYIKVDILQIENIEKRVYNDNVFTGKISKQDLDWLVKHFNLLNN